MQLVARPLFRRPSLWLASVNPYLIIASILGLLLELTPANIPVKNFHLAFLPFDKGVFSLFNSILDAFFVLDFLVRLLAFPFRAYFLRHHGWVDLLAAIPAMLLLLEPVPPLLAPLLLLRLLRFLRLFPFLRRRQLGSPWVCDRIMKLGVGVVLVGAVSISVAAVFMERHYVRATCQKLELFEKLTGSFSLAVQLLPPSYLLAWQQGQSYTRPLDEPSSPAEYHELGQRQGTLLIRLDEMRSVLVRDRAYLQDRNNLVLTITLSLIAMLLILLYYLGNMLSRDLSRITLIADSIDAADYTLLLDEGRALSPAGSFEAKPGEDELSGLIKRMSRLVLQKHLHEISGPAPSLQDPGQPPPIPALSPDALQAQFEATLARFLGAFREELLSDLKKQGRDLAVDAVRISAKSVLDYLKKHGPGS